MDARREFILSDLDLVMCRRVVTNHFSAASLHRATCLDGRGAAEVDGRSEHVTLSTTQFG